jgi:hypothetical protein
MHFNELMNFSVIPVFSLSLSYPVIPVFLGRVWGGVGAQAKTDFRGILVGGGKTSDHP